jgi:glutathione peroxidase-family protein
MKKILFITLLSLTLISTFLYFNFNKVKNKASEVILGNIESTLTCEQLPNYENAKNIMKNHKSELIKIVEIGSNKVKIDDIEKLTSDANQNSETSFTGSFVMIDLLNISEGNCANKGKIQFQTNGKKEFEEIKAIIGNDFFGVPYRIQNI